MYQYIIPVSARFWYHKKISTSYLNTIPVFLRIAPLHYARFVILVWQSHNDLTIIYLTFFFSRLISSISQDKMLCSVSTNLCMIETSEIEIVYNMIVTHHVRHNWCPLYTRHPLS